MYIYDGTPGSPIALITSAAYEAFAYEYDPFGLPTLTASSGGSGVSQNPYLFAGGIQDRTTGWVHYGNRYDDPTTGTWTQRDTLDHPLSPADANRYAYAGGDPINNTDPPEATPGRMGPEIYLVLSSEVSQGRATARQGSLFGGCVAGALGTGYTNALYGRGASLREQGVACAFGAVSGGLAG